MLTHITYFIAIMILLYLYIIFLVFVAKTLVYLYKESKQWIEQIFKKVKTEKIRKTFVFAEYLTLIKTNAFLLQTKNNRYYGMVFLVLNILFWQQFRYKEVTTTIYQHKEAREYFSLSRMLLSYEMGMLTVLKSPSSIVLAPLNALQDSLIERAKEHLPKGDGEIAYYHYMFKLYPYLSRGYYPYPFEAKEIAALTYQVLQEFTTMPIADKEIREYDKYRLYAMAAEYFIYIMTAEYTKPLTYNKDVHYNQQIGIGLFKDSLKLKQLEDISRWSIKNYEELKQYPKIVKHLKEENPLMGAMYLLAIIEPLNTILESKMFHLTYRCEDELLPIVYKYIDIYDERYFIKDMKYGSIIHNRNISNFSCTLCGREPIKGTYMHDDKSDACYRADGYQDLIEEYRSEDLDTHYQWHARAAQLEKVILKTNFREQVFKCYKRYWKRMRHEGRIKNDSQIANVRLYDGDFRNTIPLSKNMIRDEFIGCLIDNKLIRDDREAYLKCYDKEWMGIERIKSTVEDAKARNDRYEQCLLEQNLMNIEGE